MVVRTFGLSVLWHTFLALLRSLSRRPAAPPYPTASFPLPTTCSSYYLDVPPHLPVPLVTVSSLPSITSPLAISLSLLCPPR